jgi:phosphohistidine phosphatase SixA/8-oxo-dGTP pyrophosphatase MutT (NUDIX family)
MIRDEQDVILAAGAVVWRTGVNGEVEVVVIHRPQYDDWTLPKGKVEGSETLMACAYREVREETGLKTRLGPYLGDTFYEVNGIPKVVRYWSALALSDDYKSFDRSEVDRLEWLGIEEALTLITIKDDRRILKKFKRRNRLTYPLVLLRHAHALEREKWSGDDGDRPLTDKGTRQVVALSKTMQVFGLQKIESSDALRCLNTARPIAEELTIPLEVNPMLSEYEYHRDKKGVKRYIKELVNLDEPILICGHNPLLSEMARKIGRKLDMDDEDFSLGKGDAFIVHRAGGKVYSIDHLKVN